MDGELVKIRKLRDDYLKDINDPKSTDWRKFERYTLACIEFVERQLRAAE